MAFIFEPIGAEPTKTHDTPKFAVGKIAEGSENTRWVYVKATTVITGAGYSASIDESFNAVALSTSVDAEGDIVGVAQAAFAANDYGWLQVRGPSNVRVAASCGANVTLNTTSTAGQLDDDGTATAMSVEGLVLTTAREASAGLAPGVLNDPYIRAGTTVSSNISGNAVISGTLTQGSNVTDRVVVKGIYMNPAVIAVTVPTIADAENDSVDVDVSTAFAIQPAVGDAVIAIPVAALPTDCQLNGAFVSATDHIIVSFGTKEGGAGVTGAAVNFNFLVIDLT